MTYFPDNTNFWECDFPGFIATEHNGTRMYIRESGERVIVLYHGNAGAACQRQHYVEYFPEDVSVIIVEYAGYSNDDRRPSQQLILQDVHNVAEFISQKNLSPFVFLGESIGTSVAAYHASVQPPERLLFIAPFDSLSAVAARHYWYLPVKTLIREEYDTIAWLADFEGEIKIIHGTDDRVIPISHAENLKEHVSADVEFVRVEGAGHNNIFIFGIGAKITEFINR